MDDVIKANDALDVKDAITAVMLPKAPKDK
jgi:hypothetical protein